MNKKLTIIVCIFFLALLPITVHAQNRIQTSDLYGMWVTNDNGIIGYISFSVDMMIINIFGGKENDFRFASSGWINGSWTFDSNGDVATKSEYPKRFTFAGKIVFVGSSDGIDTSDADGSIQTVEGLLDSTESKFFMDGMIFTKVQ